jgi:hypothetical protein
VVVSVSIGALLLDLGLAILSIGKSTTTNLAALADCVPALLDAPPIGFRFLNVTWSTIVHMIHHVRLLPLPHSCQSREQNLAMTVAHFIPAFATDQCSNISRKSRPALSTVLERLLRVITMVVEEASYLSLGVGHFLKIPYVTGVCEELSLDPLRERVPPHDQRGTERF